MYINFYEVVRRGRPCNKKLIRDHFGSVPELWAFFTNYSVAESSKAVLNETQTLQCNKFQFIDSVLFGQVI